MKKTIITIMALLTMMSLTACGANVTWRVLTESETIRNHADEYMSLTMAEIETMKEEKPEYYECLKSCYEEYSREYLD